MARRMGELGGDWFAHLQPVIDARRQLDRSALHGHTASPELLGALVAQRACVSAALNLYLGRVIPLCAPQGSLADGVWWTAVSPVHHVDGLP